MEEKEGEGNRIIGTYEEIPEDVLLHNEERTTELLTDYVWEDRMRQEEASSHPSLPPKQSERKHLEKSTLCIKKKGDGNFAVKKKRN